MIRTTILCVLALGAAAAAAAASAAPGGAIATLQLGDYACELPGDATGPAGRRQPDEDFRVINASSYTTATGRGTYLLTGDAVVMTSGPKRGAKYSRLTPSFLRRIDAGGNTTDLRCVRRVVNNR